MEARQPLCIAPVLYFGTWRTTGSDVLSVVTTIAPFRRTAPSSKKKWMHGMKVGRSVGRTIGRAGPLVDIHT